MLTKMRQRGVSEAGIVRLTPALQAMSLNRHTKRHYFYGVAALQHFGDKRGLDGPY